MIDGRQAQSADGCAHFTGAWRLDPTGPARGPQFTVERVRGAGAIDNDHRLVAHRERQASLGKRLTESVGRDWRPRGGEHGAQLDGCEFGALLYVAAFGGESRHLDCTIQVVVLTHPLRCWVLVANEGLVDTAGPGNRRCCKAQFGGSDNRDGFPSAVVVPDVDAEAVGTHQTVDDVRMHPPALDMQDASAGLVGQAELGLEVT